MDIRDLHARAVQASVDVVNRATPADLDRPTPCAGWNLADLLAHMTVQHHGFARAARGELTAVDDWAPQPVGADFAAVHAAAAAQTIAAFADPDALSREVYLPEFSQPRQPGRFAIAAHLIDYVVHGWDVARTIDVVLPVDDDVAAEALRIASGLTTKAPAFQPAVAPGDNPTDLDRTLALLGRRPTWPA